MLSSYHFFSASIASIIKIPHQNDERSVAEEAGEINWKVRHERSLQIANPEMGDQGRG